MSIHSMKERQQKMYLYTDIGKIRDSNKDTSCSEIEYALYDDNAPIYQFFTQKYVYSRFPI